MHNNGVMEAKQSNIVKLIIMFLLYIVIGTLVIFLYIALEQWIWNLWFSIIASGVTGVILLVVISVLKSTLKITNDKGAIITTALAAPVLAYIMWQIFISVIWLRLFADSQNAFLHIGFVVETTIESIFAPNAFSDFFYDIRVLNYYGTWGFFIDSLSRGVPLAIIWIVELIVVLGIPIWGASISAGILIPELNKWGTPKYTPYNFERFSEMQLENIVMHHNIDVIINQPLAGPHSWAEVIDEHGNMHIKKDIPGNPELSEIARIYVDNNLTDYLVISETDTNDRAIDTKAGKTTAPFKLSQEKMERLFAELEKKYPIEEDTTPPNIEDETNEEDTTPPYIEDIDTSYDSSDGN